MSSLLQLNKTHSEVQWGSRARRGCLSFYPLHFLFFTLHLEYGLIKIGYVLNFFYLIIFGVLFCGNL